MVGGLNGGEKPEVKRVQTGSKEKEDRGRVTLEIDINLPELGEASLLELRKGEVATQRRADAASQ